MTPRKGQAMLSTIPLNFFLFSLVNKRMREMERNEEEAGEIETGSVWEGDLVGNLTLGKCQYCVVHTCCKYLL